MNDIVFEALKLIVMVCALAITRYVIPWIKEALGAEKLAAAERLVKQTVLWAQQTRWDRTGQERKAIVTEYIKKMLTAKNISITDDQLDILIEAAVKEMKIQENLGTSTETTKSKPSKTDGTNRAVLNMGAGDRRI